MLQNADLRPGHPTLSRHRDLVGRPSRKMTRVEVVVPTWRQVRDAHLERRVKGESEARHSTGLGAVGDADAERDPQGQQQQPPPATQIKSEDDEANDYFHLQAQIKVEVKPEEIISENVVRDRMALVGYDTFDIKIPKDLLGATATREFTTRTWGGSMQATFPKIGKEFTHGLDDFMYLSLLYDPQAPRWPGSPGLFFRFKDEGEAWPKIMRLVVRLRNNAWQYMGQYKLTAAPPLTPDEWNAQSFKVKRKWANKLSGRKFDGGLKARLVLRKRLRRDPTPQEIATALQSNERFRVSADEILEACDQGRAVVHVWCMKCVGYDVDFQEMIATCS
ncbi:hypothetical protein EV363DRAFT_1184268 [Boletus edulis]|nr:hypothetical protein EV363DRAFT_1184268 [Boletus edulis]